MRTVLVYIILFIGFSNAYSQVLTYKDITDPNEVARISSDFIWIDILVSEGAEVNRIATNIGEEFFREKEKNGYEYWRLELRYDPFKNVKIFIVDIEGYPTLSTEKVSLDRKDYKKYLIIVPDNQSKQLNSNYIQIVNKALYFQNLGSFDKAIAQFEKAFDCHDAPVDGSIKNYIEQCKNEKLEKERESCYSPLIEAALDLQNDQEFDKAIKKYEEASNCPFAPDDGTIEKSIEQCKMQKDWKICYLPAIDDAKAFQKSKNFKSAKEMYIEAFRCSSAPSDGAKENFLAQLKKEQEEYLAQLKKEQEDRQKDLDNCYHKKINNALELQKNKKFEKARYEFIGAFNCPYAPKDKWEEYMIRLKKDVDNHQMDVATREYEKEQARRRKRSFLMLDFTTVSNFNIGASFIMLNRGKILGLYGTFILGGGEEIKGGYKESYSDLYYIDENSDLYFRDSKSNLPIVRNNLYNVDVHGSISGGITFKIAHPIYFYGGAGIGYYGIVQNIDLPTGQYTTSADNLWIVNYSESKSIPFFEGGLALDFNKISLKYGIRYFSDGVYDKESLIHQFGFGFKIGEKG